ncbi:MAG: signal recognition particle-docking protein FtsY [Spirochaetales bacterium]|nr:signal recognition particle-docking protein FtsY [Spirochaetales bacterium]
MARKRLGERIAALFGKKTEGDTFFEELEDILIEGDLGALSAMEITDALREAVRAARVKDREGTLALLKDLLGEHLSTMDTVPDSERLNFFLILGVNGVGKTTTAAKLAAYYRKHHAMEAVLSAADTFRAAAIDQLLLHGTRLGIRVIHQQPGSDPGAVIFDTLESVKAKGGDIIIADTAGRMHNRSDLVRELQKIDKVVRSRLGEGLYKKLLVIDATTGQNGIRQAEIFHEAIGVDGIILAKYDSDAKGGILFSISRTLHIPLAFIGTGESYDDLKPFEKEAFLSSLLSGS